jgi:hypothetical protein
MLVEPPDIKQDGFEFKLLQSKPGLPKVPSSVHIDIDEKGPHRRAVLV